MLSMQGKVRVAFVIKLNRRPIARCMATVATRTESMRVWIVRYMTAGALGRELLFEIARLVTSRALQIVVRAGERETSLFGVIEMTGRPTLDRMAVRTRSASRPAMDIVRRVARNTLSWSTRELLI